MPLLRGTRHSDQLQATNEPTLILGLGGNDVLLGGDGDDIIRGGGGDDHIEGGIAGGNDVLFGDLGDDFLVGVDGDDSLFGGSGQDHLDGGSGNDILNGGSGDDELFAGEGNDIVQGGAGNDIIRGGAGDDTISGGRGSDIFIFEGPAVSLNPTPGHDTILDFQRGQDNLRLELFGQVSFADLDISVSNGNSVIDLSEYYGHAPGTETITVIGVTTLAASDFLIF